MKTRQSAQLKSPKYLRLLAGQLIQFLQSKIKIHALVSISKKSRFHLFKRSTRKFLMLSLCIARGRLQMDDVHEGGL